jgi:hypothetical protein
MVNIDRRLERLEQFSPATCPGVWEITFITYTGGLITRMPNPVCKRCGLLAAEHANAPAFIEMSDEEMAAEFREVFGEAEAERLAPCVQEDQ